MFQKKNWGVGGWGGGKRFKKNGMDVGPLLSLSSYCTNLTDGLSPGSPGRNMCLRIRSASAYIHILYIDRLDYRRF